MPGCKGFWEGELPPSRRWGLQEPYWLSTSCIINHPKTWWPKWTAFLLISQFLGVGHSVRRSTVGTGILPLLATSGVSAGSLKGCGQNPGAPVRSHGWWVLLAICQDLCWAEGRTPFTRTPTRCGASMQPGGGVPQTSTLRESTQSLLEPAYFFSCRTQLRSDVASLRPPSPPIKALTAPPAQTQQEGPRSPPFSGKSDGQ